MESEFFHSLYAKLNTKQRLAVDTLEGPVMVIAGPGTGKTQILTMRIANILRKTQVNPDNILALTFTEAGATNMRRRLVSIIGSAGYYVAISTFHGFCNRVIQEYPGRFPDILGGASATDVNRISIIRSIIEEGEYQYLKPFGDVFFYTGDILKAIRDLKNEGLDAAAFLREILRSREEFESITDLYHEKGPHKGKMKADYQKELAQIEKNTELQRVYARYEALLREQALYDFEDMILYVIRALTDHGDFLQELQEQYQYILVDEHQDTNGAQNRILELLCSFYDQPNLFVVGDEKQAIFRFQGASLDNFLYFKDKYKDVCLIDLVENYRSTQVILDSSQSLIAHNKAILSRPLESVTGAGGELISAHSFGSTLEEWFFLVLSIKALLAKNVPPQEIAVLYRDNNDAFPIASLLSKHQIPYVIESDQNVLDDAAIRKLILLFETIANFGSDELLARLLHVDFLGLDPLDVYRVLRASDERRIPLVSFLADPAHLQDLLLQQPDSFGVLIRRLKRWKVKSSHEHLLVFFERIVTESGFLGSIFDEGGDHAILQKLHTFFEEAKKASLQKPDYFLADFIAHLTILREHNVAIRSKLARIPNAVRLMTAHRAKGLEFDYVFITGAYDGHWGNKRSFSHFKLPLRTKVDSGELERNEDERRLFYMALTRARKQVFITYSLRLDDGRDRVPSQFISEIRSEFIQVQEHHSSEEEQALRQKVFFTFIEPTKNLVEETLLVRELFSLRGISATALNNYLKCPWEYFYSNLIRLPRAKTLHEALGTAVHASLKDFFDARREDFQDDAAFLDERFRIALKHGHLLRKDFDMLLVKGCELVRNFYERYHAEWHYATVNEYSVRGVDLSPDVTLVGKLDKLEIQKDGRDVIVVDYKVKKPESRNWVLGETANSTGNYKRQLVFYKLLLDLMPNPPYRMIAGVIDFVLPNDRGVFKKESFDISQEETQELRETILVVADEIVNLKFWDKRCDDKKCEYCRLRDFVNKNPHTLHA